MPSTRSELLNRLSRLLPTQFEQLIDDLEVPRRYLSPAVAPQVTRAVEVLTYLDANGGFGPLDQLLGPSPGTAKPKTPAAPTKHTILFLAANPTGTSPAALDLEAKAIQVELERAGWRDRFELITRWAVEPLDLLREMRKLKPAIVHFSGHGGVSGLAFQSATGGPQMVSAEALRDTFGAAGGSVKVVVLNACYSATQADAIVTHIDCAVGADETILNDTARAFAIGFYGGLGEQASVDAAFQQGRAAVSLQGLNQSDRLRLKTKAGVDARTLVLAADPA